MDAPHGTSMPVTTLAWLLSGHCWYVQHCSHLLHCYFSTSATSLKCACARGMSSMSSCVHLWDLFWLFLTISAYQPVCQVHKIYVPYWAPANGRLCNQTGCYVTGSLSACLIRKSIINKCWQQYGERISWVYHCMGDFRLGNSAS